MAGPSPSELGIPNEEPGENKSMRSRPQWVDDVTAAVGISGLEQSLDEGNSISVPSLNLRLNPDGTSEYVSKRSIFRRTGPTS